MGSSNASNNQFALAYYKGKRYRLCSCFPVDTFKIYSINATLIFASIYKVLTPNFPEDGTSILNYYGAPLNFIKYLADISDIFMINEGEKVQRCK